MLGSIYHRTLNLFKNCILDMKTSKFCHLLRSVIMEVITYDDGQHDKMQGNFNKFNNN